MTARSCFFLLLLTLLILQGCVVVQTFPLAARAGDTVMISPGSLDGATPANITLQYYSDSNPAAPINLSSNIRSVFNLTPDRTSAAWTTSWADQIPAGSGHGPWQTVIAVDLPTLPVGAGHLRVALGSGVTSPSTAHTPEGVDIALTVLSGTGAKHPFQYMPYPWSNALSSGDLAQFMPGRQYVVKPMRSDTVNYSGNKYAASEFTLSMPIRNSYDGLPTTDFYDQLRVILDPSPETDAQQISLNWRVDGDNIIVNVLSPNAKVSFRRIRFSVVISDDAEFSFSGTASIAGVKYFDINGNLVSTTPIHTLQAPAL